MNKEQPKYFCFPDANGNPVKVPLDEEPKPLSEEERKEFSEVIHKALKQLEYNCRHPRYYSKEEINKFTEELREILTKPVDE